MKVRRLCTADADRLRDIRLRALADAPHAFSSSFGRESVLDREFWGCRAAESEAGDTGAIFIAIEHERTLGMAGGFFAAGTCEVATVWGMWVDPSRRREGVGARLLEAVGAWARAAGARQLRLAVTDSATSAAAAALYSSAGFIDTGEREPLEWNASLMTRVLSRSLTI
jgi:GNAT superfamily N-acetyltransferase